MIVSLDHDLINNNTFGLHAHCSRFVLWQSADEVIMWFAKPDNDVQPVLVIGQGSNLLLSKDVRLGTTWWSTPSNTTYMGRKTSRSFLATWGRLPCRISGRMVPR